MAGKFPNGYPANAGGKVIGPYLLPGVPSYSQATPPTLKIASLRSIDFVGDSVSVSGTYLTRCQPSALGTPNSWIIRWYVVSTGLQVANAVDLSAETVQLLVLGG